MGSAPFSMEIRQSDKKCRAIRGDKPITGWCKDALAVVDAVRRKDSKPATPGDEA